MNQKITLITVTACSIIAFMMGRITVAPENVSESSNPIAGPRTGPRAGGMNVNVSGLRRSSLTASESTARMKAIMDHPSRLERIKQWLRFVKQVGPDEMEETMANFRGNGLARYNPTEYSMLLHAWAKMNPIAALEYSMKNTDSSFACQTILSSWALTDPQAAMKWVELNCARRNEPNHQWNTDADTMMVGVIRGIAASDPTRATEMLQSRSEFQKILPHTAAENEALRTLQGEYLKQGPDAARDWAMSISDKDMRMKAIARIAEKLAKTDPIATFEWLQANPGDETAEPMSYVMDAISEADIKVASEYFNKIPDAAARSAALKGMTTALAKTDPEAAVALIDAYPTLVSDQLINSFIYHAGNDEPELVAERIGLMKDDNERNRAYRNHIEDWLAIDIDAAISWVSMNQDKLSEYNRRRIPEAIKEAREAKRP